MSPPMTITAGLKKLTQPASTSPSVRPASRTIRIAPGVARAHEPDDVAAVGASSAGGGAAAAASA